ncbi:L-lactate permease [Salinibacterium sp. ZJ450]|uniref:L-lactate permease n=1 Tax=Salinibacterium sp. ZJ450 TaxID=2708338 RepID=UPI001420E0CC|nr:L-lactate permease [Salinibacterium sp. ZJ450]
MTEPNPVLDTLLALIPLVLLVTLLALRMKPVPAALIVIALTGVLTGIRFPIDPGLFDDVVPSLWPVALSVLVIIFGGVLLAEYLGTVGAQDAIGDWLRAAAHTPDRAVLLIGLGVAPFVESIVGWGLGVVASVPLLLRLGLTPTKAASIGLLGIVLGPWGSLGPGNIIMAELGAVDYVQLGVVSALFSLPVLLVGGIAILLVGVGWRRARSMLLEALVTVLVMWLILIAVNLAFGPPLGGVIASLGAIAILMLFARLRGGRAFTPDRFTVRSLYPYLVLIVTLLLAIAVDRLFPLGVWGDILANPAIWMLLAAFSTPLFFRLPWAQSLSVVTVSLKRFAPVTLTTLLFIGFGGLLSVNGMSARLSDAAASLGLGFLALIPVIGFVGGYITASSTATAAMFASGISHAAVALGTDQLAALSVQNVASGSAVMTSPSRVALAVSLTEDAVAQGRAPADPAVVMRHVLLANLIVVLLLAPLSWAAGVLL